MGIPIAVINMDYSTRKKGYYLVQLIRFVKIMRIRYVVASTIGGNTIQVGANHDVNVTGSDVLGTGDVAIVLVIRYAQILQKIAVAMIHIDVVQEKGLMGAGLGFTIGSKIVTVHMMVVILHKKRVILPLLMG